MVGASQITIFFRLQILITMKPDQDRVRTLLTETVALLCKNGLHYRSELRIQGLLGITVDGEDVFIVPLDERLTGENITCCSSSTQANQSTLSKTQSQKSVENNAVTESDTSSILTSSCGSGRHHRQRRKQSSPKRDLRVFECVDDEVESEDLDTPPYETIKLEAPPSNEDLSCCGGNTDVQNCLDFPPVKLEPMDDYTNPVAEPEPGEIRTVKRETLLSDSSDEDDCVLVGSSNLERSITSFPLPTISELNTLQLQIQAEEMAANWLNGIVASSCGGSSSGSAATSTVCYSNDQATASLLTSAYQNSVSCHPDSAIALPSWFDSKSVNSQVTALPTTNRSIREVC